MNFKEMFSDAVWLGCRDDDNFGILRAEFYVENVKEATLRVLGLGYFHCYINGRRVSDDLYLPLNSDFEARENMPVDEKISNHRIYVPEYDVSDMLRDGRNVIAIHFGGGWYTFDEQKKFGDAKAVWRIFGEDKNGAFDFVSCENDKVGRSYVSDYYFTQYEKHDYRMTSPDVFEIDFDDSSWADGVIAPTPDTQYYFSDCPADKVCEILDVTLIKEEDGVRTYDAGKNISGYPLIRLKGESGEKVCVVFSEERNEDGSIDMDFWQGHHTEYICDGNDRTATPQFTWYAFRYFSLTGNAEVSQVHVVHTDSEVTSSFRCDNDTLNWLHDTFINTQLTNMHSGIPSDCPQLERRGYTGDGQLACHAVMDILDCKSFYRKWIEDIRDCQDVISGHIQYTAPYVRSGGGPGGWGCAIVEVPYTFYKHYGDASVLEDCYPNMLRYFDYLEAHSENNLVISDKEGEWCLGDWCTPESVVMPAPFVNNYFYIKSLRRCIEIAKVIGKEDDIPMFEERINERSTAVMNAYFNTWDGNFFGGRQGANAFAVEMGLGDERTYPNTVKEYGRTKALDTGIFGTDILTRVLFEKGDGNLATQLLVSESLHSFAEMKKRNATTLWEYFPGSLRDRSHNHPMFGAVVAHLYDYLLGIRQKENSAGYREIVIAPVSTDILTTVKGYRTFETGRVCVSYKKTDSEITFSIDIPAGQYAEFIYDDKTYVLREGNNHFAFSI